MRLEAREGGQMVGQRTRGQQRGGGKAPRRWGPAARQWRGEAGGWVWGVVLWWKVAGDGRLSAMPF